jgi:isopenicillin N synthase-like dioxygenase
MHLFKQHEVRDYQAAARQIPVVDYGPFFARSLGVLDRFAAGVAHTWENVGFFYAFNHGVPEGLIDRVFRPAPAGS